MVGIHRDKQAEAGTGVLVEGSQGDGMLADE